MRIPHISSTQLDSGYEASCAIKVASLLASDLLKDTHYGQYEAKDGQSFSKLNPRHLQNSREVLLAAIAPLTGATVEIRISVHPDLLHKAQGEIGIHFVIRCCGESDLDAREALAAAFLAMMPVLVAAVPEADLRLVTNAEQLNSCLNPFPVSNAAAIIRRRQDIRLASEVKQNGIGFLPGEGSAGCSDNDLIAHILPWIPSHDDWGRLLDVLTSQFDPCMLVLRVSPQKDVTAERNRVMQNLELSEAVLAGLDASDLALRKQVSLLIDQASIRLERLNGPCFDVAALLVSSCRIPAPLAALFGTAISGNRLGGEEPAWLQGGFSVVDLEGEGFMVRDYFPDGDAPFSLGEAACAFRLPAPPNRHIPGLSVQRFKTSLAMLPQHFDNGESIRLFVNEYQGLSQPVMIDADDRMRHTFIMGMTGTGKSSLMESMIAQDVRAGLGLAVIDPHGDMIDAVLTRIPAERAEDVILFDFVDRERPLAFNVLQWRDIVERDLIIDELYRSLDQIYDLKVSGGPIFEQHFRNMLKLLMGDKKRDNFTPTLLDFIRCYSDRSFRNWLLESIDDQQVKDFIEEAENADRDVSLRNVAPYITSKFGRFVNDTTLKRIVGQDSTSFDFDDIINNGKIFLVKLGKGRFGSEVSALLANMLVSRFKHAAMQRGSLAKDERRDFYLYADEAHSLPQENFSELFSEARKYRLGLILATQYCSQLGNIAGNRGDDLLAAIFGNVGSLITFRSGAQDAEYLERGFTPVFNQLNIIALPNYHGYARMNLKGQSALPFSFRTELEESPANEQLAGRLRTLSRLKYGKDVNIVDAEIYWRQESWKQPFATEEDIDPETAEGSVTPEDPAPSQAVVVEEKPLEYVLNTDEMSVRLRIVLEKNKLKTISDVTSLTGDELLKKGLGRSTLNELKAIVVKYGWQIMDAEK